MKRDIAEQNGSFLMFVICLILLHLSSIDGLAEDGTSPEEIRKQAYVFITGSNIHAFENEKNIKLYDGTKFPLYCGYLIVTNKNITFIKRTDLPITGVVKFFDQVKKDGYVTPYQGPEAKYDPRYHAPVFLDNPSFYDEMRRIMVDEYSINMLVSFEGVPDENYSPQFDKTCTFNSSTTPPEFCFTLGDIENIIIPTSNEKDIFRKYFDKERNIEFVVQYDKKLKLWNDRYYYNEDKKKHVHEVLNSKTNQWDTRYTYAEDGETKAYEKFDPKIGQWVPMPASK